MRENRQVMNCDHCGHVGGKRNKVRLVVQVICSACAAKPETAGACRPADTPQQIRRAHTHGKRLGARLPVAGTDATASVPSADVSSGPPEAHQKPLREGVNGLVRDATQSTDEFSRIMADPGSWAQRR